jgi:probable rRNA maturation factor
MNAEANTLDVDISDTQDHLAVDRAWLAALASRTLRGQGVERASVSIALIDDATIHEVNRRHLGHDWPTDVVTFRLSEPDEPALVGELVVSAEMAAATARQAGMDARAELALYVIHGLLHLCGHDDQTPEGAAEMRRLEAEALQREGLPHQTFAAIAPEVLR